MCFVRTNSPLIFAVAVFFVCGATNNILFFGSPVLAEAVTDDFSDRAWDNGTPIAWSVVDGNPSAASITPDNSLRLDSADGLIRIGAPGASQDFENDIMSIRIEGRVVSSFLAISFPNHGHWTALSSNGQLSIGQGQNTVLDSALTGLDPVSQDVVVQMDWIGDTVSAWAWSLDNPPMTETPHTQFETSRTRSFPSVFTNGGAVAEFHSITISDEHLAVVPEPTPLSLLCLGVVIGIGLLRRSCTEAHRSCVAFL